METKLKYEEHHFQDVEDVGVAFNYDRIWVCLNGVALLRAKWIDGKLFVEFNKPIKETDLTRRGAAREEAKMSVDNWYRVAWEAIHNSATDAEAAAIESAALRAGVLWHCKHCQWNSPSDENKCGNCNADYVVAAKDSPEPYVPLD